MATYIKTLKEDNGDITYPQTKAGAVLLTNGSDLETEMAKYVTAEDIASTSALTPPVQTNMIADGAVTSDKIDWSTFNSNGLPTADGSATRSGVGTVYYKKIMPKLFLLWGNITPVYDDNAIALPFSSAMSNFSQVFTLYGAGMNSTKAYISPGSSSIGFTKQTTGNNYALWALVALNG